MIVGYHLSALDVYPDWGKPTVCSTSQYRSSFSVVAAFFSLGNKRSSRVFVCCQTSGEPRCRIRTAVKSRCCIQCDVLRIALPLSVDMCNSLQTQSVVEPVKGPVGTSEGGRAISPDTSCATTSCAKSSLLNNLNIVLFLPLLHLLLLAFILLHQTLHHLLQPIRIRLQRREDFTHRPLDQYTVDHAKTFALAG